MGKIDLHIHTKKILDGESKKRNIDNISFRQQMKKSDIMIAAITNHNYFEKNEYLDYKSENGEYILLPGIELNVYFFDNKEIRKQINVIAGDDEENVNKFQESVKKLQKMWERDSKENKVISLNNFIELFDKDKWIFLLDFKSNKNTRIGLGGPEYNEIVNSTKNAFIFSDVNKPATYLVLSAKKYNAIVGSDVTDWDNYYENSYKLLSTSLNIDNYSLLFKLLNFRFKEDNKLDNKIFKNIKSEIISEIEMKAGESLFKIKNLEIKQGINVIFGEKSTGKTEILKSINKKFENDSIYYESSKKDDKLQSMHNTKFDNTLFSDNIKKFKELNKEILVYKESSFSEFNNYYKSKIANHSIKIHMYLETKSIKNSKMKLIKQIAKDLKITYEKIKENEYVNLENKTQYQKISKNILKDLWKSYLNMYKRDVNKNINSKINDKIQKIIKDKQGKVSEPKEIGFLNRYEEKKKFLQTVCKIQKFIPYDLKKIWSTNLPKRGEITLSQRVDYINLFNENCLSYLKGKETKCKSYKLWDMVRNIKISSNFNKISEAFNAILKNSKDNEYDYEILYKNGVIMYDSANNENFSNGEKAYLALFDCLQSDKKIILLDEPDAYLGKQIIKDYLLEEISKKINYNEKIIVISTHDPILGINTVPINYIYREHTGFNEEYKTYISSIFEKKFKNLKNPDDYKDLFEVLIENFEGGNKIFNFRKELYE
ncbi:hypothetical protein HGG64_01715 [Mycoplasma phocoeninasale]|uniref:Uncharacterized protein n=1 Tax=Mycoplasma phocoeninasale TaxID=2726117 RepID=A0A858U5B2_9MOLU|nr:hypothetical protein [Mycoplasma phocoeninasale]QJG66423.1 hypothetical protein HGG64_01715 [Mycoplasma phocoeninasale]